MLGISSINSTPSINSAAPATPSNQLGKYEFLKILAAEMQYQDPTNPTSNTEFIGQLAQFSSLEQMQNISDTLNSLAIMQSAGLIGKFAFAESGGATIEGKIESISIRDSIPHAIIGDYAVPINAINKVAQD
jgi:flagellar basal-body rod modification protein FlgD